MACSTVSWAGGTHSAKSCCRCCRRVTSSATSSSNDWVATASAGNRTEVKGQLVDQLRVGPLASVLRIEVPLAAKILPSATSKRTGNVLPFFETIETTACSALL